MTFASARGGAAAGAARTTGRRPSAAQSHHSTRWTFDKANREHPLLKHILTFFSISGAWRFAFQALPFVVTAAIDQLTNVDGVILTNDDVFTARTQGVPAGN